MTISTETRLVTYTGNGATTEFDFAFHIPTGALVVTLYTIATGVESAALSDSLYSVTGLDDSNGGTVTYPLSGSPLASTHKINIKREVPLAQGLDLTNQSAYFPAELEEQLDLIVMMIQQHAEELGRAVKTEVGSTTDPSDLIETLSTAAADAEAAVTAAEAAQTAAEAAETAAVAAAGSISLPASPSALDYIRRNAGNTAYEARTPTQVLSDIAAAAAASPSFTGNITVTLADDGATGPAILTYHNSASPAASDVITQWFAYGRDSAANYEAYTTIRSLILDATSGSEDGQVDVLVKSAGAWATVIAFRGDYINLPLGQLKFPATQNPSADANTLDDYEEGTFTPAFSAVGATFSYATQYGSYTKIGNRVFITIRLALNTSGNTLAGATLKLTGLPFANGEDQAVLAQVNWSNSTTSYIDITGQVASADSDMTFYGVTAATANKIGGAALTASAALHATNGSVFRISMSYRV